MRISIRALAGATLAMSAAAGTRAHAEHDTIFVIADRHSAESEIEKTPGGADLVIADDYEDRLAVSLRDALAFSPGVYAQPRFGQEVRLSIRGSGISRGFHMRGLMLLQDGIPINLADDNGDFQELDPLIFQHIEVYRGANALRFGGSTLGGGVNGVTPTGRAARGFDGRLDGGSFETLRGKAAFGFAEGAVDGWFALTGERSDGDREHAQRDSLRSHSNLGIQLGDHARTRFYASAQTIDQELPGALGLADATAHARKGNTFGDQARDIDSIRLQNRTQLALGSAALEFGGFVNIKEVHHPIFQVVDQASTDWGLFARLDLAHGPFEVRLGSTARFGTVESRRYVNVDGDRGAPTFAAHQRAQTIDVYGEGRYRTGPLTLIAGAIYTHGQRSQDQVFPIPIQRSARFGELSPRVGLLWEPNPDVQIYANYSRSHEMPGFIELAQLAGFVPLEPQRAWTAEAGARGRIGIARFDLSFYRATLKAELLQYSLGPDIPASTFNAGRTVHQGIEAGLELEFADNIRLRQVYQLNDFRFRDDPQYDDNRLPVIPRHLYRAQLRIGSDRLHVDPSIEWVPSGAWADYSNGLKVGGYAMLGVTAAAGLNNGISLFVDARNLAGTKGIGDVSAAIAATPASLIFYPIEGRALYGGVRAHF